jgi:exportin-7
MHVNQSLQQGLTAVVTPKLDASLVYFFSQYRKSYVGETNAKAVYKKPMQMFGIENQDDMLNLIMRKM